ncbi:hypothetical protein Hanom_Chr10g00912331 [Helianthus anomalus]
MKVFAPFSPSQSTHTHIYVFCTPHFFYLLATHFHTYTISVPIILCLVLFYLHYFLSTLKVIKFILVN